MFSNIEEFLQKLDILKDEFLQDSEIEFIYKRRDKVSLRIRITTTAFSSDYS
ncbi:MAG: hypothetical protein ACE5EA_00895 [Nitrospirota bacterium]